MTTAISNASTSIRLSFQLMTCAEPPKLVIETIKSLLVTKSAADEILIIDNNNTKKALYEPLEQFCAALDPSLNVRFFHVDAIPGFKAGALNLALELMDTACSHIVVVDSDYQALPTARSEIAAAIATFPQHALLQFPQFYRDEGMTEVHGELNHYFNHHIYRDFNQTRVLSTGTYAVLRREDLIRLGGWSGASITEDAQLGVLMHKAGFQSRFIPKVIANGLLPMTLCDLVKQRQRWIYGNMQVLSGYFSISPKAVTSKAAPNPTPLSQNIKDWRAHFSQLSAWVNFTAPFILLQLIMVTLISGALIFDLSLTLDKLLLPLFVVYAGYGVFLARRLWAYLSDHSPLNRSHENKSVASSFYQRLKVWALHLNFWELGAMSWLPVLWGRDKPFICTPKQSDEQSALAMLANNIKALPRSLLLLNMLTAVLVAPISPFYSPALFAFALIVFGLKLWAAKIILSNYQKPSTVDAAVTKTNVNSVNQNRSSALWQAVAVKPVINDKLVAANSEPFSQKISLKKPEKAANF